ncbi:MAG: 4-hydroxybenzoate octaprenyltransferase [Gammaproteobacteria bacterium]|nr:4-hydroxybenzoate octaprenyltransferase [Gammaproteobacteria bacterium]MCW8987710.1 4-hydroxybenzoate octaprenyltransferase [Gammaproteobacteria bacterium]
MNWRYVRQRAYQYAVLARLNKPIGIFLLLWPALWALWIAAEGMPRPGVLTVFVLGVILMRSAGCVINDYADREIDPRVNRTKDRPIASGRVSPDEAMLLFMALCFSAFLLVLTMNTFTILLSIGGVMLAAIYPFMKRYTHMPQIILGMAFGWAVPMAFAAQTNSVPKIAWLIYVVTVLWAVIYDTMYAMADRMDDLKIGVKSTAILFGDADRVIIGILQAMMLFALYLIGQQSQFGTAYNIAVLIAAILMVYHQYLIRYRQPALCISAFLNNNWLGAVIFIGIAASYY